MERLTHKCNNTYFYNVDDVFVVGKRLGAFEDLMEKYGLNIISDIEDVFLGFKHTQQENQALKERWQKLKECLESIDNANWITRQGVLKAMQELEKE